MDKRHIILIDVQDVDFEVNLGDIDLILTAIQYIYVQRYVVSFGCKGRVM
jgi:hypothetical protein